MRDYNDVNGTELAYNRITIKYRFINFFEGGGKTLQKSTITVPDTRQYACNCKDNIILSRMYERIYLDIYVP